MISFYSQIDTTDDPVSTVTAENLDIDTLMHTLDLQTLQQSWKLLTSLLSSDIDETLYQEAVTLDQP